MKRMFLVYVALMLAGLVLSLVDGRWGGLVLLLALLSWFLHGVFANTGEEGRL